MPARVRFPLGNLGRVHLLRGLAYERLGEAGRATREFKEVVATWQGADEPLLTFVQQAQAGLADSGVRSRES